MDTILTLIVIEQSVATVFIAIAIVANYRARTRILESQVEPSVQVNIDGDLANNLLSITNEAGCAISNLTVVISAGCTWDCQPYLARHCLYFGKWEDIPPCASIEPVLQPLKAASFTSNRLPSGVTVDANDIQVEYFFARRADKRRYSGGYQLGVVEQANERLIYIRMAEKKVTNTMFAPRDEATPATALAPSDNLAAALAELSPVETPAPCIG